MNYSARILAPLVVLMTTVSLPVLAQDRVGHAPLDQPLAHAVLDELGRDEAPAGYQSPMASAEGVAVGVLTLIGGDQEARMATEWAADVFVNAGLTLPHVTITFHSNDEPCGGYEGVFRQRENPARIDICNAHRLIILHELVHAWENATLTDTDRTAYIGLRGLSSWNDGSVEWEDRGIEDLASVVAWGLLKLDRSEAPSQLDGRTEAFSLITGIDLSTIEAPDGGNHSITPAEPEIRLDGWDHAH